jgi:hypothetical protein
MDIVVVFFYDIKIQMKISKELWIFKEKIENVIGCFNIELWFGTAEKNNSRLVDNQTEYEECIKKYRENRGTFEVKELDIRESAENEKIVTHYVDLSLNITHESEVFEEKSGKYLKSLAEVPISFEFNNSSINLKNLESRKKLATLFKIAEQEPINILPNFAVKRMPLKFHCSFCYIQLKSVINECDICENYKMCDSCYKSNGHQHKVIKKDILKHVGLSESIKRIQKLGFKDIEKIKSLLLSSNLSVSRTLSALIGF